MHHQPLNIGCPTFPKVDSDHMHLGSQLKPLRPTEPESHRRSDRLSVLQAIGKGMPAMKGTEFDGIYCYFFNVTDRKSVV